jgi:hypothetical protein
MDFVRGNFSRRLQLIARILREEPTRERNPHAGREGRFPGPPSAGRDTWGFEEGMGYKFRYHPSKKLFSNRVGGNPELVGAGRPGPGSATGAGQKKRMD